jgi:hypothetical protein
MDAAETDAQWYADLYEVGWPDASHRALRNSTSEAWEGRGPAPAGESTRRGRCHRSRRYRSARRESFENREPRGIAQEYVQLTHQPADLGQLWYKVQLGRPGASYGASALLKARSKG